MANAVAELVVNMTANTAAMRNDIAKATRDVSASTKRMESGFKTVRSSIVGAHQILQLFTAGLGIRAMVQFAAHADETAKSVQALGISLGTDVVEGAHRAQKAVEELRARFDAGLLKMLAAAAPGLGGGLDFLRRVFGTTESAAEIARRINDITTAITAAQREIAKIQSAPKGILDMGLLGGATGREKQVDALQQQILRLKNEREARSREQATLAVSTPARSNVVAMIADAHQKFDAKNATAGMKEYFAAIARGEAAAREAAAAWLPAEAEMVDALTSSIERQRDAYASARANTEMFASTVSSGFVAGIFNGQKLSDVFRNIALNLAQMVLQAQLYNAVMGGFGFPGMAPTGVPQMAPPGGPPAMGIASTGGARPLSGSSAVPQAVRSAVDLNRRGIVRWRR